MHGDPSPKTCEHARACVGREGIEPSTKSLKGSCSTTELPTLGPQCTSVRGAGKPRTDAGECQRLIEGIVLAPPPLPPSAALIDWM